jgi:hypothetical protein
MKATFLTIIILLGFSFYVFSQDKPIEETKYFDIKLAGLTIGEMKVTKKLEDTITYYTLDSKVKFWFFVTIQVEHKTQVLYQNNKLIYSKSTSVSNNGNFTSDIVWNKDKYDVNVNSYDYTNKNSIDKAIEHNVVTLYFNEPKTVKKILLDGFGLMTDVTTSKAGLYQIDVLGNKNSFEYKDGKLIQANMYSKFKNYNVVARNYDD